MNHESPPLFMVKGLTQPEQQSLLFELGVDPVAPEDVGYAPGAMGDFGISALVFVASVAVLAGIMHWVEKQEGDVRVKISVLKLASIEVSKNSSLSELRRKARDAGVPLEGD